jgi:hypothetical protein
MKMKKSSALILLLFGILSCKPTSEPFIGKWQILKIVENNESTDLVENWINLKNNGTFESYDGEFKKQENGKWLYSSEDKVLLIDGEGEEGDSEWILNFKNDSLVFHSKSNSMYLISKRIE